jgi:hypothetical protein
MIFTSRCIRLFLCLAVLSVPSITATAQTPPTTTAPVPGVATGERIGNVVKAAINTAFPAVGPAVSAIMSLIPNNTSKNVKTADVTAATTKALTDASTTGKVQAAQAIAPIGQVGAELATVNLFLAPSVEANNDVLAMQIQIAAAAPDWDGIKVNWSVAKAQLTKISAVQDADINKVQDLFLRNKLTEIRGANSDLVIRIDAAVTAKNAAQATPLLAKLTGVLGGMPAAAGYELANLQGDLASLASWAKGTGGTPAAPSSLSVYTKSLNSLPAR